MCVCVCVNVNHLIASIYMIVCPVKLQTLIWIFRFSCCFFSVPDIKVTSLRTSNITAYSFRVQFFLDENQGKFHGRFKEFQLSLVSATSDDVFWKSRTTNTWFLFDNLMPYTQYEVRVAVKNTVGAGSYSQPFKVETLMAGNKKFATPKYSNNTNPTLGLSSHCLKLNSFWFFFFETMTLQ